MIGHRKTFGIAALLIGAIAGLALLSRAESARQPPSSLWPIYTTGLAGAKYIDLTHAFAPRQARGAGLGELTVSDARAASAIPGLLERGDPIDYAHAGAAITAYGFGSDQIGTQLDPPAHFKAEGATISDIPPTYALRPLVVINIAAKVAHDPGYEASPADIADWERRHGRIPAGSVVMFRSDWSRLWSNPERFGRSPHPGVSLPALKLLHLQRHILFHGHETLDTDNSPDFAAEAWLLTNNFVQAESVNNLDLLPETGALISIGFARPEGGTGGLARFVAIVPPDWPHGVSIADMPGAPLPVHTAPLARGADGVLRPAGKP